MIKILLGHMINSIFIFIRLLFYFIFFYFSHNVSPCRQLLGLPEYLLRHRHRLNKKTKKKKTV